MTSETILLVDDEVNVLSSLSRSLLDEDFGEIKTAQGGYEALEIIKDMPNLAVIISDYHMPGMNGVDLLVAARTLSPDATRILLTGGADLEMAVDAVNRGSLFRFLIKPCQPDVFITTIKDGIRQNQLIIGERELLSKTLNGSIKVMIDILAALNPDIFAKANRLRKMARDMAGALHIEEQSWEIELAALLSQIGAVTIPRNILLKWQTGKTLEVSEKEMIRSIPKISKQFIKNIPRLENIANAVGFQDCSYVGKMTPENPIGDHIPLAARILKIIIDFDRFEEATHSAYDAFQAMSRQEWEYDPMVLEVFEKKVLPVDKLSASKSSIPNSGEKKIAAGDLKLGMQLTRDITDKNNIQIASKGTIITEVLLYKLINYFRSQSIVESVFIESS